MGAGRGATLWSSSEVETQLQKGMDEAEILLFGSIGDCFLRKASFSEPQDLNYTGARLQEWLMDLQQIYQNTPPLCLSNRYIKNILKPLTKKIY